MIAGLLLGACGGGDDEVDADLVQWFVDEGEPTEIAECLAEELSSYSVADLDEFASGDFTDLEDPVVLDIGEAVTTCGA